MENCIHRIPIDKKSGNSGVEGAATLAINSDNSVVEPLIFGNLTQQFNNGLCGYLTQKNIGPIECSYPQHNEDNCPVVINH